MSVQVRLSDLIAPSFVEVHRALKSENPPSELWLNGGRGSTKSSFVSIEVILGMMQNPGTNAAVLRLVADTLRDSVYEQYLWAIDKLGVSHLWHASVSPLRLTYRPTGQRIVFRGADDPKKIKSIKFSKGELGYLQFEELAEFKSMEDVRSIKQSLVRGTDAPTIFYTYNPPPSLGAWVNEEVEVQRSRPGTLVHKSDYTTVPPSWLGAQFIAEAEHLKAVNLRKYNHEYLGKATGTGAEVFSNLNIRSVSDAQVKKFDHRMQGLDFGFAADPTAFVGCYYNPRKQRLVIYDEIYMIKLPTDDLARKLKKKILPGDLITADSAEPRTIHDLRSRGIAVNGAKKGQGSIHHGIKWLQDLAEIIIDPVRAPNAAREFAAYELERDRHGNFTGGYPDKDNHTIDATRYATERVRKGWLT